MNSGVHARLTWCEKMWWAYKDENSENWCHVVHDHPVLNELSECLLIAGSKNGVVHKILRYYALCIQFLNRGNNDKNNTFPLGKQICFTIVWGCAETLPILTLPRLYIEQQRGRTNCFLLLHDIEEEHVGVMQIYL